MILSEKNKQLLDSIKDGLIVSCQAKKDDPIYLPGIIEKMAEAAIWGGAVGLRLNEPENIRAVRKVTNLPIIGLWKQYSESSDVFLTPTLEAVDAVVKAGADILALDATNRLNINNKKAYTLIKKVKEKYPDLLILGDIRNAEDAKLALNAGADMIAPTLYRFDPQAKSTENPDFKMLAKIIKVTESLGFGKVLMEGKIHTPEEAMESLYLGAYAVVVGSAITRPHLSTKRFVNKINRYEEDLPLYY